jgi:hypothetical protein
VSGIDLRTAGEERNPNEHDSFYAQKTTREKKWNKKIEDTNRADNAKQNRRERKKHNKSEDSVRHNGPARPKSLPSHVCLSALLPTLLRSTLLSPLRNRRPLCVKTRTI